MMSAIPYVLVAMAGILFLLILLFLWGTRKARWAYKVFGVDSYIVQTWANNLDRQRYFERTYKDKSRLIKHKVVKLLREREENLLAGLLIRVESVVRREESLRQVFTLGSIVVCKSVLANILHIDFGVESAGVTRVYDVPEEILVELDKLERAAELVGVK